MVACHKKWLFGALLVINILVQARLTYFNVLASWRKPDQTVERGHGASTEEQEEDEDGRKVKKRTRRNTKITKNGTKKRKTRRIMRNMKQRTKKATNVRMKKTRPSTTTQPQ